MNKDTRNQIDGKKLVTVFGGSGFVGRHVVGALAKRGYHIRVAVRRPDLAFHLQPLGNVGQIQAVQANLRYAWSVERAIEGADAVINLVGILAETGKQKFDDVQCRGAGVIAENCKKYKAPLVHVSSIGADPESRSEYCKSKGKGEQRVHEILKSAIILRPSIIFGTDDGFFNKFAEMARISPFLPLIGGGKTLFQPVYVGDVAKAVVLGVEGRLSPGKIYELGGDEVLSFRQCLELMQRHTGRRNMFIHIPWSIAWLIAKLTDWIPWAPMTVDQVRILRQDNIVSELANSQKRTLSGIGINPKSLAAILPTYLVRFRPHGQFSKGPFSEVEDGEQDVRY
jgi:uncharacterized protein YbjT (DUF2867 family)